MAADHRQERGAPVGKTSIEWTSETWNSVRGCSRVSDGCRNCYAERLAARGLPGMNSPTTGEPFAIMTPSGPRWTGKVELIESMLDIPLKRRKPTTYFVNSMSDLFHESLPDEAIDRIFAVMALCPQHTFQILTKRAERMREYSERWSGEFTFNYKPWYETSQLSRILPNVWLGVSVEGDSQHQRIWDLLKTPAALRFISYEPALEPLDLDKWEAICKTWRRGATIGTYLDWVIIGGESGPGARAFNVDWARKVVWQCKEVGVPAFVKQLGALPVMDADGLPGRPFTPETIARRASNLSADLLYIPLMDRKGGDMAEWPEDLRVRQMPEVRK